MAREASVSRRSGVVKRRASAAETTTDSPSANRPMAASSPVTLAMRRRPVGVRVGRA